MGSQKTVKDITAVICSWNTAGTIAECMKSLQDNGIGNIILVDADSDDGTREIAKAFTNDILSDPRQGLATARNIGISKVKTKYVLNWGADNVMPAGSLEKMLNTLLDKGYSGVSAMTLLKNTDSNYISWSMNHYKIARFYPGERTVIGTPTLFEAKLLQENPYDNKMSWSDDGDLCSRLSQQGHKFAITDTFVYEIGSESMKSVHYRWKGYGKSDWETFAKNSLQWSFWRKLYSLSHPFRHELFWPFVRTKGLTRFGLLPFLLLITVYRYYYWTYFTFKNRKLKNKYKYGQDK